jgi:hypothetical protein
MPTRKKRNNNYTVKKQKGGGPNKELLEVLKETINQNILKIDIPDAYNNLPNPMKINKIIIIACLKRIDEKYLEMKKSVTNKTPEEIHKKRGEEIIKLYNFIPKPLKIDDEINHIFIYYEPHVMVEPTFPKRLLHNEITLKTAIERDPNVFYKIPKIYKRKILRDYPDLLLKSRNRLDINVKGKIRFDPAYLGLVRRVDAYAIGSNISSSVIAAGLFGPELANVFGTFVQTNIATPITAALSPVGASIAKNIAEVGAALSPVIDVLAEIFMAI